MDRLASQHHLSDYNRLRYGQQGSPLRYSPLSGAFPAQFALLQRRQRLSAELQTRWSLASPRPADASLSADIQAAIDEPLAPQAVPGAVKTSMTHPINISSLLPAEAIALVSSHTVLAPPLSPFLLELPRSFHVQNVARPGSLASHIDPPPPVPSLTMPPARSELSAALEAAISASLPCSALPDAPSPAISLSLSIEIPADECLTSLTLQSSLELLPPDKISLRRSASASFSFGNLYMSSCPGKKVRLGGPVNGRSAVCRDLDMDLVRMKSLGVGCIVCCLDDEELDLLGAPWPMYEQVSQSLNLDVLRLPIPEGLPPLTPAYLDLYLGKLLQDYTLKGVSVLVHCRGGVGRAGVVACCWLIKLGICGWVHERHPASTALEDGHSPAVIDYVDTVITFVRQRRNYKAIETFEQVQFLVNYVEFLQNKT